MTKRRGKSVNPFDSGKSISRGRSRSGGGPKGMLQQLQGIQHEMLEAQEEIAGQSFTATAGGGVVTAVVSGDRRVEELVIEPEVVDPENLEMLQDLIIAVVNKAMEEIDESAAARMADVTGGLGAIQDWL
ncbi:MAG: YbaB/EbfC family nucleoid-associated protein [Anaerolineae bacterium]